ncbi:MAG: hypothetical protein P1P81_07750, partial [Desulfobulbales bacterium]|nr:hypothetical protein [Desulfobulbales bacterium]
MANKQHPLIIILLLLLGSASGFTGSVMAADPVELQELRQSFEAQKQSVSGEGERRDLINNYIQQLTDLATNLRIYKNDREGTNAVRQEIRNAKKQLALDPSARKAEPRPEPEPEPEPKPEPKP